MKNIIQTSKSLLSSKATLSNVALAISAIFMLSLLAYFISDYFSEEKVTARKIERFDKERLEIIETALSNIETHQKALDILNEQIVKHSLSINRFVMCKTTNENNMGKVLEPKGCETFIPENTTAVGGGEKKDDKSPSVLLKPDELFYTTKLSDKCVVSQNEEQHYKKNRGGVLATDVACGFKSELFAPDYNSKEVEYTVKNGTDELLGRYVELHWEDEGIEKRWIIGHIRTKLEDGVSVKTGYRIGEMQSPNKTEDNPTPGATTGYHTHIELWYKINGEWKNQSYTNRSTVIENTRKDAYVTPEGNIVYFTNYDLGNVNQNDSEPCVGASGKKLCTCFNENGEEAVCNKNNVHTIEPRGYIAEGLQTIALTVDMRKKLGVSFGNTVTLKSVKNGTEYHNVVVNDEMGPRFRRDCIKREGYCIKGDIAKFRGESIVPGGAYEIVVK